MHNLPTHANLLKLSRGGLTTSRLSYIRATPIMFVSWWSHYTLLDFLKSATTSYFKAPCFAEGKKELLVYEKINSVCSCSNLWYFWVFGFMMFRDFFGDFWTTLGQLFLEILKFYRRFVWTIFKAFLNQWALGSEYLWSSFFPKLEKETFSNMVQHGQKAFY